MRGITESVRSREHIDHVNYKDVMVSRTVQVVVQMKPF